MNFRSSFCDPFKKDVIELGDVEQDKIMEQFEKISWKSYLEKMKVVKPSEIYYSPSYEVENKETRNGLTFSAIDDNDWYIFYKRPKMVSTFFGFNKKMNTEYVSDVRGQTTEEVRECLQALINNNLKFLEDKIK